MHDNNLLGTFKARDTQQLISRVMDHRKGLVFALYINPAKYVKQSLLSADPKIQRPLYPETGDRLSQFMEGMCILPCTTVDAWQR